MSFIRSIAIQSKRTNPFPYNIPAIKHAKAIVLDQPVTFLVGDNGTGKSTLLETVAYRLQLPLIGGQITGKRGFEAAIALQSELKIDWIIERAMGFFFRAEDFSQFIDGVERTSQNIEQHYADMRGEVPDSVIEQMKANSNFALRNMQKTYGQDMLAYSHGEAYLKILKERISARGIYLLDEPEAALSPGKQISLIYFIKEHLKEHQSQFIIATHSPILMALPGAGLYEITEEQMQLVLLEDTEHFSLTKSFLNNPEAYLRHLE